MTSKNEKRTISLDRFIYALGIHQVGTSTAKLLAQNYQNFEHFQSEMMAAFDMQSSAYENLLSIEQIGPAVANDLVYFFHQDTNQAVIADLLSLLTIEPYQSSVQEEGHFLYNKVVVFTGSLEKMSRHEAKETAEKLGAKVTGSVSKKTDYVIIGQDPGSKAKKAASLNIKILSEDEWLQAIKETP